MSLTAQQGGETLHQVLILVARALSLLTPQPISWTTTWIITFCDCFRNEPTASHGFLACRSFVSRLKNDEARFCGLRFVFYLQGTKGTKENNSPGPFARGTTDANGKFTLVSRDGSQGATVGPNRVEFETAAEDTVAQEELDEAAASVEEAKAGGDSTVMDKATQYHNKLLKRFNGTPRFPESLANDKNRIFEVPSDGTDSANFYLKSE